MSFKYDPPMTLRGSSGLDILDKIWTRGENMDGFYSRLGFLFIYELLNGEHKCKLLSSGFSGWQIGNRSQDSSSYESHRLAVLLLQLFKDRHTKSIPASILNILSLNRRLCRYVPKFKGSRYNAKNGVFNGWIDKKNPKAPLADLFNEILPLFQKFKKLRGAIRYPPKAPYDELPEPISEIQIERN